MADTQCYKILGIGTPIVDQTLMVSEAYLKTLPGPRGGSEPIDSETLARFLKECDPPPIASVGGSTVNTIKGLSCLGHSCTIIGKIGEDSAGEMFRSSMNALGIKAELIPTDKSTAQVVCFISPDRDRTMRSHLGAGFDLKPEDLNPELFKGVNLVHIEGYLLALPGVVKRAMELAKDVGAEVSFDLSSFEIVAEHRETIVDLLSSFVKIVFANAEETSTLTGLGDPKRGCIVLKDLSDTAIVKMGGQGGWASDEMEGPLFYKPVPAKVLDTTGAGDYFASGFLHGHILGKKIEICSYFGAVLAAQIVQVVGADLPTEEWKKIKQELS